LLFTKVGAVILLVSDVARSTKFYKDILELPIKTKSSDWVEFFATDTTLALHPIKNKSKNIKPSSGGVLVGFMVSDLESTAKTLKEKNVKFFKEPKNESFGKHAIIEDPDGHLISIAEMKSKAADEFDLLGLLGAE
jgi:catechol 2,3-dioxygenase-like lactoylglutathione lyase family enzyme